MTAISTGQLADRVAIVTGGGSRGDGVGTGRAAAVVLARRGARVLVADRDGASAQTTVGMITGEGGTAEICEVDVLDSHSCESMAQRAIDLWGRIDILDNNVGGEGSGTLLETDENVWDQVLAINVKSMMLSSKAVLPWMIGGGGGAIVNISSISAWCARGLTPYTMAKGAVISLTRAMAVDHGKDGVRVNCIAPGPIYTPMVSASGMAEDLRDRRRMASLLEVEGTAWDVGEAVAFLASDSARYITGVLLPVDGGVSIRTPDR